jgi:hypothetical protein
MLGENEAVFLQYLALVSFSFFKHISHFLNVQKLKVCS